LWYYGICIGLAHANSFVFKGLAFRVGTRDLFSAGADRSVKIWNCTDMIYVQALYGHKANINCLDALTRETCVTVAADKTIALWNIVEENCLVFRGPKFSLDSVAMINEEHFVCGGQDGYVGRC
jgi:ribosomal RNA-processing protein 9